MLDYPEPPRLTQLAEDARVPGEEARRREREHWRDGVHEPHPSPGTEARLVEGSGGQDRPVRVS